MTILKPLILIKSTSLTILMCWLLLAICASFSASFFQVQLTDSNNRVNLALTNMTLGESATGLIAVNGIVLNNSTLNVENIKVDVSLFDVANNTIRETSRFVTAPFTIVEPNSTETFEFLMLTEDYDHYSAIAYADRVD